ncbi:MAG: phage holin family protein [Clostridia bacterium]|nr:phage holin family protein [Clostridia bacterium]
MAKRDDRRRGAPWVLILLTCVLAVPTVGELMGIYPGDWDLQALRPALLTGAALGVAHLVLRPVLRLIFSPLGCLTLGLFGLVIDLALIYLAAACVEGFEVPSFAYALVTALLINAICAIAAGRR